MKNELLWKDEYSVGVVEIDDQHKKLFGIVNTLIKVINSTPNEEEITKLIGEITKYKKYHFATEEKYFHQFNFSETEKHEKAHKRFDEKLQEIQIAHQGNTTALAFALVDFLEDWLVNHLMHEDQKYKQCFHDNGLR